MQKEHREYISKMVTKCNAIGDKVSAKSPIFKLVKVDLKVEYSLDETAINECLTEFTIELEKIGLWSYSRSEYSRKSELHADCKTWLEKQQDVVTIGKKRYLFNSNDNTYELVTLNISRVKTAEQLSIQQSIAMNKKVTKKDIRDKVNK